MYYLFNTSKYENMIKIIEIRINNVFNSDVFFSNLFFFFNR